MQWQGCSVLSPPRCPGHPGRQRDSDGGTHPGTASASPHGIDSSQQGARTKPGACAAANRQGCLDPATINHSGGKQAGEASSPWLSPRRLQSNPHWAPAASVLLDSSAEPPLIVTPASVPVSGGGMQAADRQHKGAGGNQPPAICCAPTPSRRGHTAASGLAEQPSPCVQVIYCPAPASLCAWVTSNSSAGAQDPARCHALEPVASSWCPGPFAGCTDQMGPRVQPPGSMHRAEASYKAASHLAHRGDFTMPLWPRWAVVTTPDMREVEGMCGT